MKFINHVHWEKRFTFFFFNIQLEKGLNEDQEKLKAIVDPAICGTFAIDSLRTVVELTLNCLSENVRDRPSIDDVLWNLQYSVQVQEGWASSGNLSVQF